MKKTKINIPLFCLLFGIYLLFFATNFMLTRNENADVIQMQSTAESIQADLKNVQENLRGIQTQLQELSENSDFPKPLMGAIMEPIGKVGGMADKLDGSIKPLNGIIGPLNAFKRVDTKGMTGVVSQLSAFSTVLLVLLCGKPGYISSAVLNIISSLYTLTMAVIIRGNTSALPGVFIPLISVITNTVIFIYLNKNRKMHDELNESYEQAIENNRIIQEKDEVLSYLAYYDRLTQMPNRHLFMENIEERVTNGEEYTIIYADIDNFRHINDSFGHSTGDELLIKFAQRIEGICGEEIFSAKIGGDEYGFILPAGYTQNDVVNFIGKLQGVFGEIIEIKGERFSLTSSFGAATFPNDARSSEDLFRCAETAMFTAKTNGKNQLCFYNINRF